MEPSPPPRGLPPLNPSTNHARQAQFTGCRRMVPQLTAWLFAATSSQPCPFFRLLLGLPASGQLAAWCSADPRNTQWCFQRQLVRVHFPFCRRKHFASAVPYRIAVGGGISKRRSIYIPASMKVSWGSVFRRPFIGVTAFSLHSATSSKKSNPKPCYPAEP